MAQLSTRFIVLHVPTRTTATGDNVHITSEREDATQSNDAYDYPDEDFCQFSVLPHKQLIFPIINLISKNKHCSCTFIWLIQKVHVWKHFFSYLNAIDGYEFFFLPDQAFKSLNTSCDFKNLEQNCDIQKGPMILPTVPDIINMFAITEFALALVIQPIACIIAIGINVLSIHAINAVKRTIRSRKEDPAKMYSYMQWNAMFNIFYTMLFALAPMNVCVDYIGIFCSTVMVSVFTQYYKILFLNYLGTFCKLCSNLTGKKRFTPPKT